MEASDNSQIGFIAMTAGTYHVSVQISGPTLGCSYASGSINVDPPGANVDIYRLRTVPPTSIAPPQEMIIQVRGGGDYDRAIALDPGVTASGSVVDTQSQGVPAYVKFMPVAAPYASTELFTQASGAFSTSLLGQSHNVLVMPSVTGLAPRQLAWSPGQATLQVRPGTIVTGFVRNPAGNGFSGAKVQLHAGGTPSTLATTLADGSFSLRTDFPASTPITVRVTPPAASGLPRLEATAAFDLGQSLQINYASGLAPLCDLANTPVQRGAVNQPGAKVTIVGMLAGAAGSVTAGVTAAATGTVRMAATADGSGRLPALLVPRAPLSAVVSLAASDYAVDPIDTSTCAAQTIDAPAPTSVTGTVRSASNAALANVRVEATPIDVLALADAQPVTSTTSSTGAFSVPFAAGGRYDVRFIDPYARGARLTLWNTTAAGVPATASLPPAIAITGKVSVSGSTQPIPNTSIQLLCAQCSGIEATRPLAETATNPLSEYRLTVSDPGTL
jgi:hypothetical protein